MIYNEAKVRRLSTIFQVDTCKTKKERIAHVQLSKACAVAHLVVEIQAMIYNVARVRRLFTKFQVNTCKTEKDTSCAVEPSHDLKCGKGQEVLYKTASRYMQK